MLLSILSLTNYDDTIWDGFYKEFSVKFLGLCQVPVSEEGAVLKAGNLDCLEN